MDSAPNKEFDTKKKNWNEKKGQMEWKRERARAREKGRMRWMYEWMNKMKIAMVTVHITVALIEPFVVLWMTAAVSLQYKQGTQHTGARARTHTHTHINPSVPRIRTMFWELLLLLLFVCLLFVLLQRKRDRKAHNRPDEHTDDLYH